MRYHTASSHNKYITVKILLFAKLREQIGQDQLILKIELGTTVSRLKTIIKQKYSLETSFFVAINQRYVLTNHVLNEGDEVALIPPVSGGSGDFNINIEVNEKLCDIKHHYEKVKSNDSGAIVLFAGNVREFNLNKQVATINYSAYYEMATRELYRICANIFNKFEINGISIAHRTGMLKVGETSLIVAVSAAHRKEAIEVLDSIVDQIKQLIPIWKREYYSDGSSEWL